MSLLSSLTTPLFLLGAIATLGQAQDISVTPRLSVGVAKGMGITDSVFKDSVQEGAALFGSADGTYTTKSAINAEVSLIFSKPFTDTWSLIGGPGFVYSKNTNDFSMTANGLYKGFTTETIKGTDEFTSLGGKLYAGVGVGNQIGFHAEFLPFIGFASVKESLQATGTARNLSGILFTSPPLNGDATGTMTLYGFTVGGYYTTTSNFQLGARLGYVGASGKIDGDLVEQSGVLAAAEVGYVF